MEGKIKQLVSLFLLVSAGAVSIIFDAVDITFTSDAVMNKLLSDFLPRAYWGIALIVIFFLLDYGHLLRFPVKGLFYSLVWCIPVIFVVLSNFPFTAIIGGAATVSRADLIWLSLLKCLSIGLMEELLFRGLVQSFVFEKVENKRYPVFLTILLTSALFGVIHLVNLFVGGGLGGTLLQVVYSFLIGAMLSAVLFKTKNIWLCVLFHAMFNFGGSIIGDLGSGAFQDTWFWIFTFVFGAICAVYVIYYVMKEDKMIR